MRRVEPRQLTFVFADSPEGGGPADVSDVTEAMGFLLRTADTKEVHAPAAGAGETEHLLEEAASLLWMDAKTKCPVRAAFVAVFAVSSSLISPTNMISGSSLMMERRPAGKSTPAARFT